MFYVLSSSEIQMKFDVLINHINNNWNAEYGSKSYIQIFFKQAYVANLDLEILRNSKFTQFFKDKCNFPDLMCQ